MGVKERGSVGALVDGGVRDIRWLSYHNFPVFARYRTPVQSIGRWKVVGHQISVNVRGATSSFVSISPGDFILGDEDGVIVIPAAVIIPVLERAEQLTSKEVAYEKICLAYLSPTRLKNTGTFKLHSAIR